MKNVFYRAMLNQRKEKTPIGKSVLAIEYDSLEECEKVAKSYLLTNQSTYEIREYSSDCKCNIISFDAQDTGKVVACGGRC